MSSVATLAPAAGVAGALVLVIAYLLKANASDRRDYQEAVDRAERRADEAAVRLQAANAALDEQRTARRLAEDAQSLSERRYADLLHESRRRAGEVRP